MRRKAIKIIAPVKAAPARPSHLTDIRSAKNSLVKTAESKVGQKFKIFVLGVLHPGQDCIDFYQARPERSSIPLVSEKKEIENT